QVLDAVAETAGRRACPGASTTKLAVALPAGVTTVSVRVVASARGSMVRDRTRLVLVLAAPLMVTLTPVPLTVTTDVFLRLVPWTVVFTVVPWTPLPTVRLEITGSTVMVAEVPALMARPVVEAMSVEEP